MRLQRKEQDGETGCDEKPNELGVTGKAGTERETKREV